MLCEGKGKCSKNMVSPIEVLKPSLPLGVGAVVGFAFAYLHLYFTIDVLPAHFPMLKSFQCQQRNSTEVKTGLPIINKQTTFYNKTLEGKGVISQVMWGLGNQLHHYACMYALAKDLKRPLYNFVSATQQSPNRKFLPSKRDFALDKFQIPLDNLIDSSTIINSSVANVNDSQLLFRTYPTDNDILRMAGDSYCRSYAPWFQYKDEIVSMFQLKPEVVKEFPPNVIALGKDIESSEESVAVHVRRGDFTYSHVWKLPISYQRESISKISEMLQNRKLKNSSMPSPTFFIFSDDPEYCKMELKDVAKVQTVVFVSSRVNGTGTISLQDFYLMTKCKHFIVPNSTYGWWAAYLATQSGKIIHNGNSIVIASDNKPSYWKKGRFLDKEKLRFYKEVLHAHALFPKGWIVHYPSDSSF